MLTQTTGQPTNTIDRHRLTAPKYTPPPLHPAPPLSLPTEPTAPHHPTAHCKGMRTRLAAGKVLASLASAWQKHSAQTCQQKNNNSSESTLHKPQAVLALLGTLGQQVMEWGKKVIFFIFSLSLAYFELQKVEA